MSIKPLAALPTWSQYVGWWPLGLWAGRLDVHSSFPASTSEPPLLYCRWIDNVKFPRSRSRSPGSPWISTRGILEAHIEMKCWEIWERGGDSMGKGTGARSGVKTARSSAWLGKGGNYIWQGWILIGFIQCTSMCYFLCNGTHSGNNSTAFCYIIALIDSPCLQCS